MEKVIKTQQVLIKQIVTIFSNKKNNLKPSVLNQSVRPVSSAPV